MSVSLELRIALCLLPIELPVFNMAQLHPRHVLAQAREHLMARLAALRPR